MHCLRVCAEDAHVRWFGITTDVGLMEAHLLKCTHSHNCPGPPSDWEGSPREQLCRVTSVRIRVLRRHGFETLSDWAKGPDNVYIGRGVGPGPEQATLESEWGNPFKIENYERGLSLRLYREWVVTGRNPITGGK